MQSQELSEENNLIQRMSHRLDLLTKIDKHIKSDNMRQELRLSKQKEIIDNQIDILKNEIFELERIISSLRKTIFSLGRTLKRKVSKKELEEMNKRTEARQFELLITRKELPVIFNTYANNKN